MSEYWDECISEACEDAGVKATAEQVGIIASWVQGAHENYGMAYGHDCIGNPLDDENKRLKRELRDEREKQICKECKGRGRIISYGPSHSSDSECMACRGAGRI